MYRSTLYLRSVQSRQQGGYSTFVAIAAIVGLGIVFLTAFFLMSSGGKPNTNSNQQQTGDQTDQQAASNEPPFIRVPENSKIYENKTYGFLFAYPNSFGDLTSSSSADSANLGGTFTAESALAARKPVGTGTAIMSGRLSVNVFSKDTFKVSVSVDDISVAPTKTGDDITWKVVSRGSSDKDVAVGNSYQVKSVKSQTGVPVFDFTYRPSSAFVLGRWVFASGDNYVMISLPTVNTPTAEPLSDSDLAAYNIIGNNIAKTVRVPAASSSGSNKSSDSSQVTSALSATKD